MLMNGSLFSGIGGLDLGLEKTGHIKTIWFSENDPYACKVLTKHWPNIPNHGDMTKIDYSKVERPNLVSGGFPCQDLSIAGKGEGIHGSKSGLWKEMCRCVSEIRPDYVLVENVPMLLNRGFDVVLGDLAENGYDAEWMCVSASGVGALHRRSRIFIMAHARHVCGWRYERDAYSKHPGKNGEGGASSYFEVTGPGADTRTLADICKVEKYRTYWEVEPELGRVADGISHRMDRHRCLGNSVVPQVSEYIGLLFLYKAGLIS